MTTEARVLRLDNHHIGWVVRRRGRASQKNHLIQSTIADAAITKCGRRMEPLDATGRELVALSTGSITCKHCQPVEVAP